MDDSPPNPTPIFPLLTQANFERVRAFSKSCTSFVRAVEFGLAFACVVAALTVGADPMLLIVLLVAGWVFAILGILSSNLSDRTAKFACFWAAVFFAIEGALLHLHAVPSSLATDSMSLTNGASITFSLPPTKMMADGLNILPIRVTSSGDADLLNYTYYFGQAISDHLLSIREENNQFDRSVTQKFYPEIQKASAEQLFPEEIYNSLSPGGWFELGQPRGELSGDQIDRLKKGLLFLYDFLVVRYTDKNSMRKRYYYGEYCARRLFSGVTVLPCAYHNFIKKPGK